MQSRYTEARKAATSAVKKSKEKSWEEFGRRLDSNYFSANKVFWQTIRRLRGKRSSVTYSNKDSDGNILTDENEILSRWREYFEDLLNPVKTSTRDTPKVTHLGEEEVFTAAEVATAIKGIKSGKAVGEDEIRPEMLKALTGEGILWLTRVCQVAWKLGKTPRDWQTGVIIPIFKKGDRKQCTNYRGISLLRLLGKVYAKCLEKKCREIVESKLEDGECGFRPGRSIADQIFTLKQSFEKSWEYGKDLFACFVDLEKAYDRVPRDKLWKVLQEYGVNGQLLRAIKSFYCRPEVCVRVNGKQSKQRWSRGHKTRGQGQGHKKNPRPRPRTAFPRTDPLEAKDRNARGQGPRTQAQILSKKKKKVFTKIFQAISKKKKGPHKNFIKRSPQKDVF